ncbi:D-glycero-D-manno-heptose 1,7-bisphosphate phosphatase [Microbacterium trichothecenolyticum]|uniref:D-glycero-alpha-D-manno-heptose-1,7-bisphosphate 7-phosphatase n=1 Tax=Microbacterium trichothecenolyticum TaxID=69370 RepID=UPI0028623BAC|nr:HAD-IIIA family hydrolase [Microbacterium trichothecenolyticum]MDR7112498.1 D-glycero-D-manno-heptose 1,7-bisphosphate phosphatase [Microbacterium trichothecenolyticum]
MTHSPLATMVQACAGRSWSLFLDRDGVINTRIMGGYVRTWDEFAFEPGALEALEALARWAPNIVVATNQQGVGKALMTEDDLADIHGRMRAAVAAAGGRIDAVQWCPHLAGDECDCRKPKPGMATRYLADHPGVDGSLSVMVGDTESDMEMGRRLAAATGGCITVRIGEGQDAHADLVYPSLAAFAAAVTNELDEMGSIATHSAE